MKHPSQDFEQCGMEGEVEVALIFAAHVSAAPHLHAAAAAVAAVVRQ